MTEETFETQPNQPLDPAALLAMAVEVGTGGSASRARVGQGLLSADVAEAFQSGRSLAAIAPTGTGKSFAYLAAAAAGWINHGHRTLVTTGGLGLQAQLNDKDLPVIAEALRRLGYDKPFTWAVRKGFANYPCRTKAQSSLDEACERSGVKGEQSTEEVLADLSEWMADSVTPYGTTPKEFADLLGWALSDGATERGDAPHVSDSAWSRVSCSSSDCIGEKCPHVSDCPAVAARWTLYEAAVVITNHHTLGIQAASNPGIPVLLNSDYMGPIHQVVVDEAHALPQIVRDQGAARVDGKRILRITRLLAAATDIRSPGRWAEAYRGGEIVAGQFDSLLTNSHQEGQGTRTLVDGDELLAPENYGHVLAWCAGLDGALRPAINKQTETTTRQRLTSVLNAVGELRSDIDNLISGRVGWARWIEREPFTIGATPRVCISPVSVAPLLGRFWGWPQEKFEWSEPKPPSPLPVVAVSATLPRSAVFDLGLPEGDYKQYESPFGDAYAGSAIFIPRTDPALVPPPVRNGSRKALDTHAHAEWAIPLVTGLVTANSGGALVLSATTRGGQLYAAALSEALGDTGIEVISQWSAGNATRAVEQWRQSNGGVLVGTRSLMTGVDAPGDMCSLVIIDRSPRSMSNPVDDARVEAIVERAQLSKWEADRLVYVADAALLLEQAAGRLVRRETDRGVVAVLDPRLLEDSPIAAPATTRLDYMAALKPFRLRTTNYEKVVDLLRSNAAARKPAEAA